MLVLSRKLNESIIIGDETIVTVSFIGSEAIELTVTGRDNSPVKSAVLGVDDWAAINDQVRVILIRLEGERARLGIEYPPDLSVARMENPRPKRF